MHMSSFLHVWTDEVERVLLAVDIRIFHINTKLPMFSVLVSTVFTVAKMLSPVGQLIMKNSIEMLLRE